MGSMAHHFFRSTVRIRHGGAGVDTHRNMDRFIGYQSIMLLLHFQASKLI